MRFFEKNGPLSVHAIAGSYVVLLGIDMEEAACEGVLGFGIERVDHGNRDRSDWLRGLRIFPDIEVPDSELVPTNEHPVQAFLWGDFTTRYGREYTYRIVAMRGQPGALQQAESVKIRVSMESEDEELHAIYFNRGVAGSQAYVRKFENRRPNEVPNREAWRWLSRGLYRAMLNFIRQANGPDWALRAAVYEFQQDYVLKVLRDVAASGADVRVIFDARETAGDRGPARRNWEAIRAAGIEDLVIPRTKNPSAISHNKFIILLRDGQPVQVWTGSTNLTDGGIFGHSNCGHVVRDPRVAEQYLRYWEKLSGDPEMSRRLAEDEIRPWNDAEFAVPQNLPPQGCTVLFSPRSNLDALNWYAERMDAARTAVFLTAAFGVNDQFEEVFEREKDYLRYVMLETEDEDMERLNSQPLNCIAIGNVLVENEFERWLAEQLSDLNRHVKYIHTKYMLIDPLGEDPIVITGSANFSDPSTRRNDENMLLIRGDRRVADLYLTEFIRLFNHFQFRMLARAREATGPENSRSFLAPDDSWKTRYYTPGTRQFLERHYFAGP